jgi:hypothetical protein
MYQRIEHMHPELKKAYPDVQLQNLSQGQLERLVRGDELYEVLGPSEDKEYNSREKTKIEQKRLIKQPSRGYSLKSHSNIKISKNPSKKSSNIGNSNY